MSGRHFSEKLTIQQDRAEARVHKDPRNGVMHTLSLPPLISGEWV